MPSLTDVIFLVLTRIVSTTVVLLYFLYLLEKRFANSLLVIIPTMICFSVQTYCYVKINNYNMNFVINILTVLIIMLFFKPLKQGIFYAAILEVIMLLSDGAITFALTILSISIYSPLAEIVLVLLTAFLVFLFAKRFKSIQNVDLPKGYNIAFISIPMFSVFILYRFYVLFSNNSIDSIEAITIVAILYALNIVSIFMYSKIISYFVLRIKNDALHSQIEAFVEKQNHYAEAFTNIYTLQHNMKNQLLPVSSLLDSENYDLAKEKITNILGGYRLQQYIEYTGISFIDDMINYKRYFAEDILFEVTSVIPRPYNINFIDLSSMIGIALDNAIEACAIIENKKIRIDFHTEENAFIVGVSNYMSNTIKRDNSGTILSTKSDDSPHGMGLISIKSLIDENNGELQITVSDDIFKITLILFEP